MPSAKSGAPGFVCEAVPMFEEYARTFTIDQTGNLKSMPAASGSQGTNRDQSLQRKAQAEVVTKLRDLVDAERNYVNANRADSDKDGDGVPDYGTLAELSASGWFRPGPEDAYVLSISTKDSASNNGVPAFTGTANPQPGNDLPVYTADQTGNIQIHAQSDQAERSPMTQEDVSNTTQHGPERLN
jgi:hypothetical protein